VSTTSAAFPTRRIFEGPTSTSHQKQPLRRPATARPAAPQDNELRQLLERARDGDTQALGQLYDIYSPAIYRYLCRRCGDPEVAQDLTSGVFLKVLEAIHAGHCWSESFTGWLYRIAQNLLIDHVRSVARRPQSELPETVPCAASAAMEDNVERACTADEVRDALHDLRPEYANVLVLRFAAGLTHAEVGRLLDKNEDTVKVTQHRALKSLRKKLAQRPAFQAA
jgi:RNA polymerase sigma-70 factor (ECF subfamily)